MTRLNKRHSGNWRSLLSWTKQKKGVKPKLQLPFWIQSSTCSQVLSKYKYNWLHLHKQTTILNLAEQKRNKKGLTN